MHYFELPREAIWCPCLRKMEKTFASQVCAADLNGEITAFLQTPEEKW